MLIWLYRGVVLLVLCVLGWQVYIYGMGKLAGEAVKQQLPWQYEAIKAYYRPTADTLIALAERAKEVDKEQVSAQLSLRALSENPSSGRAAAHLLSLYINTNTPPTNPERTAEIAGIAGRLWPAHTYTRSRLADYWARQSRLDKVIPEWNVLLTRIPAVRSQLFPNLYQITAQPEYNKLLTPYTENPPLWWPQFFAYLSREASPEFLQKVYEQRLKSHKPLEDSEKRNYVERLFRDKRWNAARQTWLAGLTEAQQKLTGLVYDGGFEGDTLNTGFDWQISTNKQISIKRDMTYGIKGRQAMHIQIRKGPPVNFQHLSQKLALPSGEYQLSMLYRLDTFKANKGLRWRLRCLENQNIVLGETDALKGQKPWSTLATIFTIPDKACEVQLLRLEADSRYRHQQEFEGHLWFDNIDITRVTNE